MKNNNEEFLNLINDEQLEGSIISGTYLQEDSTISYEIKNLYKNKNNDKYVTLKEIKKNPPKLLIFDDLGNQIEFVLTKNFSKDLLFSINEVNRAYNGFVFRTDEKNHKKGFLQKIKDLKKRPIRNSFIFLIIIILGYLVFLQK